MNLIYAIPAFVWLLVSVTFFTIGEFLSKKFSLNPNWYYVFYIVVIYAMGTLAWLPAILQKNQLSITGTLWAVLSFLSTIFVGLIIFSEKLNLIGVIGVILALVSIVLLSFA